MKDPRIQKWLGQVVGKEGEDFSRHDKWLCMMYPRLQLLRKMLAPTGAIFISIDDNEQTNLKLICDEIFGTSTFVANITWQRTLTKRNDSKGIPAETEHLLVYSKSPGWSPNKLARTENMNDGYSSPDGDPIPWTSVTCSAPGASTHQGMVYAIQHPITGELMYPPVGRCWTLGQDGMFEKMNEWAEYKLQPIADEGKRREICKGSEVDASLPAMLLADDSEEARSKSLEIYNKGLNAEKPWPTFFFTSKGRGGMRLKKHLAPEAGRVATNFWPAGEVGTTDGAKRLLANIFDGSAPFDTPKPPALVQRCIELACNGDAIILDSFAGSASTAQAVLQMNSDDALSRRFILIELDGAFADTITAERVRRVMSGFGSGKNRTPGIDSGFSFYELGPALFNGDGALNKDVSREDLKRYVWYTETKADFADLEGEHPYLLGELGGTVYYLAWEPEEETTLDYELLGALPRRGQTTVVYADRCGLAPEQLKTLNVVFKQIPRQIARF